MNSEMVLMALVAIQGELKAPKDQNAGRYRYRNIEDINEAVKPLAARHGCAVIYSDKFIDGVCVSTCKLQGQDGEISADGCAYVETNPKNMSKEQASGAASSYARKYAACGLFAIDSSENDPDAHPVKAKEKPARKTKKATLEEAQTRLVEVERKYCELFGYPDWGEYHRETVMKRSDYANSVESLSMIADELENEIQGARIEH